MPYTERSLTHLTRFTVGLLGAGIAIIPPLASKLSVVNPMLPLMSGTQVIVIGTMAVYVLIGIMAVLIVTITPEEHIWKCALDSIGLPGLVTSLLTGVQVAVQ